MSDSSRVARRETAAESRAELGGLPETGRARRGRLPLLLASAAVGLLVLAPLVTTPGRLLVLRAAIAVGPAGVRGWAIEAAASMGPEGIPVIADAFRDEELDLVALEQMLQALGKTLEPADESAPRLARELAESGGLASGARDVLLTSLSDAVYGKRWIGEPFGVGDVEVAPALSDEARAELLAALARFLREEPEPAWRARAVELLDTVGPEAVPTLLAAYRSEEESVRTEAIATLRRIATAAHQRELAGEGRLGAAIRDANPELLFVIVDDVVRCHAGFSNEVAPHVAIACFDGGRAQTIRGIASVVGPMPSNQSGFLLPGSGEPGDLDASCARLELPDDRSPRDVAVEVAALLRPVLEETLTDSEERVACLSARALGRLAVLLLGHPPVEVETIAALRARLLEVAIGDPRAEVRGAAAIGLAELAAATPDGRVPAEASSALIDALVSAGDEVVYRPEVAPVESVVPEDALSVVVGALERIGPAAGPAVRDRIVALEGASAPDPELTAALRRVLAAIGADASD